MLFSGCVGAGALGVVGVLMGLAGSLGRKAEGDRESNSPFECGFDPFGAPRLPFSLRFYLIAVVFLVFDVEIVLFLPLVFTLSAAPLGWFMAGEGFLLVLLLGLIFEWTQGAFEWTR